MNLSVFKTTLIAAALTLAATGSASAAVAWDGGVNTLALGSTISSASANASAQGWTGNSTLTNAAWGMQGSWGVFQVTDASDVVITASSLLNLPSFTLYKTQGMFTATNATTGVTTVNPYNGNTVGPDATVAATNGAIHKFSQVALAGGNGLVWATATNTPTVAANAGVGIVETLGYVNSATKDYSNFFGDQVLRGAHDVSIDDLYEQGIAGSVWTDGANTHFASLSIHNLAAGWYNIFIGGAQDGASLPSTSNGPIGLTVAAVPVPGAVWLFSSALLGLIGASRRKQSA